MAPPSEIEYLKHLVSQLNDKIKSLEEKTVAAVTPSPAEQLRMILVGPPGAGTSPRILFSILNTLSNVTITISHTRA